MFQTTVKRVKFPLFVAIAMTLLFALPYGSLAQTVTATISGNVTDPNGALIVGAKVTALNLATKVAHTDITGAKGQYSIPLLPPGMYSLTISANGFKTEVQTGIVLEIEQEARINPSLIAGGTTESVEVKTSAPLTDTDSAAVGTLIANEKIVELPLNGRKYTALAYLVPGVYLPPPTGNYIANGDFAVAGSNLVSNYYTLDGFNNTNAYLGGTVIYPNVDTIQEFKIQVGTYEAEYGRDTGGQVVLTSKSGTNQFHGDMYEFVRNSAMDAKNFFQQAGTNAAPFSRNQFGGTIGGPIIKGRTFFFAGYEQLLANQSLIGLQTIPTPAMASGNFSAYSGITIHAPTGYSSASVTGGKVINTAALTPSQLQAYNIAQALLAFYPAPTNNNVSAAGLPSNNYNLNVVAPTNQRQWDTKLDHVFRPTDSIYFTGHYADITQTTGSATILPAFQEYSTYNNGLYGVGYTHIFTPNLINLARIGFNRYNNANLSGANSVQFDSKYGIPGFNDPLIGYVGSTPISTITGYNNVGSNVQFPQLRFFNNFMYSDQLLWNRGKHSIKVGAEYQRGQVNVQVLTSGPGQLTFNAANTAGSGYSVADAVFGLPYTATDTPTAPKIHLRETYVAAYVQDEYKAFSNLTINYGLRWETITPMTDTNNGIVVFNQADHTDAAAAQRVGANGRFPYAVYNGGFGPRLGISWQPLGSQKTVIRAGIGIGYDQQANGNAQSAAALAYPIRATSTQTSSTTNQLSLPNPFTTTLPGAVANVLTTSFVAPNWRSAMVTTMSLGVQQQLSKNTMIDVSYLGSRGNHLSNLLNSNQGTPATTLAGVVYPYPFWTYISYIASEGHSNYDGLLIKLDRHLSNGFSYLVSYAYAKSMDNTEGVSANALATSLYPQDSTNLNGERGLADTNIKHQLVVSPVYQLPFGAGKPFLKHGLASNVFGGFELAGIIVFQTGPPYTPYLGKSSSNANTKINGYGYDRPNSVPGLNGNTGAKTTTSWANAAEIGWVSSANFAVPAAGTFGNNGRNNWIGPGYNDTDINIARTVRLPRTFSVQFRAEMFNMFNHPNFEIPTAVETSNAFNTLTVTNGNNRQVQFGAKLLF